MAELSGFDPDDEDLSGLNEFSVGKKIKISLADMDLPSWRHELLGDLELITALLDSINRVQPEDDAKLQHLLR
ncbi:hypothetical protein AU15_11215 [Marinobacter salarius]|uniref:Uncharacterized protein n=1 Tax=Marinobacter salarius TaxID=1420917 RepID=W5YVT8_9GAMM|nr:hypothetical protein AU15_11215 [Marinobacter salarius]